MQAGRIVAVITPVRVSAPVAVKAPDQRGTVRRNTIFWLAVIHLNREKCVYEQA